MERKRLSRKNIMNCGQKVGDCDWCNPIFSKVRSYMMLSGTAAVAVKFKFTDGNIMTSFVSIVNCSNRVWRLHLLQPYLQNGNLRYTAVWHYSPNRRQLYAVNMRYADYKAFYDKYWLDGWRLHRRKRPSY